MVANIRKDQSRSSIKDLADHFFYLDNQMIEIYCGSLDVNDFTSKERSEVLEDEAFMFYSRMLSQELEFVLNLPFVHFWAEITKDSQVIDFLDAFLLNVRKRNDVYKL